MSICFRFKLAYENLKPLPGKNLQDNHTIQLPPAKSGIQVSRYPRNTVSFGVIFWMIIQNVKPASVILCFFSPHQVLLQRMSAPSTLIVGFHHLDICPARHTQKTVNFKTPRLPVWIYLILLLLGQSFLLRALRFCYQAANRQP